MAGEKGDRKTILDSFFSAIEGNCCPASYRPQPNPDTLDYLFEHIESFTCKHERKEPEKTFLQVEVHRDNSMLEYDVNETLTSARTGQASHDPGQQRDALDYVFENVERYACNEAMPDEGTSTRHSAQVKIPDSTSSVPEPVQGSEDEIQLYFRPKRGSQGRSRKAVI